MVQFDLVIMELCSALNLKIHLWHKSIAISFVITNVAFNSLKHDDMLLDLKCHVFWEVTLTKKIEDILHLYILIISDMFQCQFSGVCMCVALQYVLRRLMKT